MRELGTVTPEFLSRFSDWGRELNRFPNPRAECRARIRVLDTAIEIATDGRDDAAVRNLEADRRVLRAAAVLRGGQFNWIGETE